jgi:hypothetical protein
MLKEPISRIIDLNETEFDSIHESKTQEIKE